MIRTAKTENGWVKGIEAADPRITAFKGVPFAAPPVGENRWRAPQPCADWEGVREAYRFAPIAVQDTPGLGDDIYCREWHVDPEIDMGEDCLYLNIWTGAKVDTERRPVLVWFYGGALQWGYPAEMEFDGERLARRGVVVVTVNYRINVFGFLAHKDLTEAQPEGPANFGSLDQQAGIRWVVRNIAAFGGDPGNITIAGQSAGGGSVLSQMAAPSHGGLFQKAMIMSAMSRNPYGPGGIGTPAPLEQAEEMGRIFLEDYLGVKTIEEARGIDAFTLRAKYAEYARSNPRMLTVEDHVFCVGDPMKLFLEGKCADVTVMAGNTADEFHAFFQAGSPEELQEKAKESLGAYAEEFLACPEALETDGKGHYAEISTVEPTVKTLFLGKKKLGSEKNCYYYRFDADIPGWDHPGTFHSVDLWFFFETLAKCWRPFVGRHYDLARQMCNYWANFIKTGDPNGCDGDGTSMPEWRPYTAETPWEMVFTANGPAGGPEKENALRSLAMKMIRERFQA